MQTDIKCPGIDSGSWWYEGTRIHETKLPSLRPCGRMRYSSKSLHIMLACFQVQVSSSLATSPVPFHNALCKSITSQRNLQYSQIPPKRRSTRARSTASTTQPQSTPALHQQEQISVPSHPKCPRSHSSPHHQSHSSSSTRQ